MKSPIVIVDYDPAWAERYEAERQRLVAALGSRITVVEHVGSTSVPGLGAKPVIDIMIGVRHLDDAQYCISPMQALGYEYVPALEAQLPERRYFRQNTGGIRSHQVHMVEEGGAFWQRHLAFRDYLRAHPDAAREYEALKRALAAQYGADRAGYTDAKTEFIRRIETLALSGSA